MDPFLWRQRHGSRSEAAGGHWIIECKEPGRAWLHPQFDASELCFPTSLFFRTVMTSTAATGTSCRADLAAYLAASLAPAAPGAPSHPITAELIETLIASFERAGDASGQRRLSLVSEFDQLALAAAEQESQAVAATLRSALDPAVIAAAGESANKTGTLATLVVEENRDMKAQVQAGNLVIDMHKDLVQMLGEMLPRLEAANADKALLASAHAMLSRAQAIQEGRGVIPAGVSPMRILSAIERVSQAHHEVLMRYGSTLDKGALVRGMRVVGEAARLLEEIHGPAGAHENDGDEEQEAPGQRL